MVLTGEAASQSGLPFSEQGMLDKVARTPVPVLLYNLIEYPHGIMDTGTGYAMLTNRRVERMGLSDEDEHRLFMGSGPANDDEEELLHLTNVRGTFAVFTSRLLRDPAVPESVRTALAENAFQHPDDDLRHLVGRTMIISQYANHLDDQERETALPTVTEDIEASVHSLYEKADRLIGFFRAKRGIPYDVAATNHTNHPYRKRMNDEGQLRLDIADYFIKMFSPDIVAEQMNPLGSQTFKAPEVIKREFIAYRNSPQFRVDLVDEISLRRSLITEDTTGRVEKYVKALEENLRQLDAGETVQDWWQVEVD